jgi:glycine/D-amino acid oxidase-like deaminating enzyme
VILTDPITNLKINGTFHYEKGYYYFRNIQNRVLLGGGRNLDFTTETTTSFGTNSKIKDKLISDLNQFILPNQEFSIAMEWSGIMAFGKDKMPILQRNKKNIAVGVRLGGMGIAIGSKVGEQVAVRLQD